MRKLVLLIILPLFLFSANNFEKGVGFFLNGEKKIAKAKWKVYFGKRKDPLAKGFLVLADGDYIKATYYFNSYRKESRDAYYGKYEWLRYLGLSLAIYDIAYFQREWFISRARKFYPDSPIIIFVQGVYDLEMGRLAKAEKELKLSVGKLKDPIFQLFLARLYIEKGELSRAEELFNSSGKNIRIGMELAETYHDMGEIAKGHEVLMTLPKTRQVVEKIADFAFALGNDYAIREIEALVPEDSPLGREIEAFHYMNRHKYKKAEKILEKLSLYRPSDPHIWKWLAITEKKAEKKLKYQYLSFFNGGEVENLFGVVRKRFKKIDQAKWLGEDHIIILGRLSNNDEYGLYSLDVKTWERRKIPLRLEIEDFYPQKDGKTLVIASIDRIRGRRVFYIWNQEEERPRKAVVLSLTEEKFKGEIKGNSLLIYSNEYDYLPFRSPFKKLINERSFLFLYSKDFPHRFVVYSLTRRRARKIRFLKQLPFIPQSIRRYISVRKLYFKNSDFRRLIDSHSSFRSQEIEIEFQNDDEAVVLRKEGGNKYLLGFIYKGDWTPFRLIEDDEEYTFLLWVPSMNLFVCRNKDRKGYMYRIGDGKFRKVESDFAGVVFSNGKLYFLAGDNKGKSRLYALNPVTRRKEKLTGYMWIGIEKKYGKVLLKDPATAVYVLAGRNIIPAYVESDYTVEVSPGLKKVFLFSQLKKWAFLVQLNR